MQVLPTGLKPKLSPKHPIKAVLFDIYGTLLISATGDIDRNGLSGTAMKKAISIGGITPNPNLRKDPATILLNFMMEEVRSQQHESQYPYPEVDIVTVWQCMLQRAHQQNIIQGFRQDLPVKSMAFIFELFSNAIYLMPGANDVVPWFQEQHIPLGIVSNAQFYTPVIMNKLLWGNDSTKDDIKGFVPELSVYSYKLRRSKPDPFLFYHLIKKLKADYNILPRETLFVGNDMLKDIYTGAKAGVQTALFAGDNRSLRLRTDDKRVHGLQPDYIITELTQLKNLI